MDLQEKIQRTFNEFNGRNLEMLNSFYAEEVHFRDPVGAVEGLENLKKYYAHAYKNVQAISFHFQEFIQEDLKVGGAWVMTLQARGLNKGKSFSVSGFSRFTFKDGKVIDQQDYLDLGAMLYERLPLQGAVIRAIKRLLHA